MDDIFYSKKQKVECVLVIEMADVLIVYSNYVFMPCIVNIHGILYILFEFYF